MNNMTNPDQKPKNTNIFQSVLWHLGARGKSVEELAISKEIAVRKAGVRKLGEVGVALAVSAGLISVAAHGFDHSPSTELMRHEIIARDRAAAQAKESEKYLARSGTEPTTGPETAPPTTGNGATTPGVGENVGPETAPTPPIPGEVTPQHGSANSGPALPTTTP